MSFTLYTAHIFSIVWDLPSIIPMMHLWDITVQ